jgi:hypothetical protein
MVQWNGQGYEMGIFNKKKENIYEGLRNTALHYNAADVGLAFVPLEDGKGPGYTVTVEGSGEDVETLICLFSCDNPVCAAVVDFSYADSGIATLVCMLDGTVSMYYNKGGGTIGLGHKYQDIREASLYFLSASALEIPKLRMSEDLDLPSGDACIIRLLSRNGMYRADLNTGDLDSEPPENLYLYGLAQNVLTKIRTSSAL